MSKLDFIKDCSKDLPPEGLKLFCERCLQPQCCRSQYGTSKFDQRTQTWVSRLFTEVPTMDPTDPRFNLIKSQNFNSIQTEPLQIRGGQTWLDPRETTKESPIHFQTKEVEVSGSVVLQPSSSEVTIETAKVLNTRVPSEIYLPGAPPKASKDPKRDPWAVSTPLPPGEVIVSNGATIKLGGKKE